MTERKTLPGLSDRTVEILTQLANNQPPDGRPFTLDTRSGGGPGISPGELAGALREILGAWPTEIVRCSQVRLTRTCCARCAADPRPPTFGDDRKCAFRPDGTFTPENWQCATLEALLLNVSALPLMRGCDESIDVIPRHRTETTGFIVLTRYKNRGCTSAAMVMGDFWPARVLTLHDALVALGEALDE